MDESDLMINLATKTEKTADETIEIEPKKGSKEECHVWDPDNPSEEKQPIGDPVVQGQLIGDPFLLPPSTVKIVHFYHDPLDPDVKVQPTILTHIDGRMNQSFQSNHPIIPLHGSMI